MTGDVKADPSTCQPKSPIFTPQGSLKLIADKLSRREPVRILAIGSSSTQGIGASSPDKSYPAQLQNDLQDDWKQNVTVVNAGIGGETAIQTIERLDRALASEKFDLVIWQVGTNDAVNGVDEAKFRALLERGISSASSAGVDMILLDQQYFPTIKDLPRYERFVSMVNTIGTERKVSVFSRYALMRQWNDQSTDELKNMLSADSFHMGDKGYDCLADRVATEIETMVSPSNPALKSTVASAEAK